MLVEAGVYGGTWGEQSDWGEVGTRNGQPIYGDFKDGTNTYLYFNGSVWGFVQGNSNNDFEYSNDSADLVGPWHNQQNTNPVDIHVGETAAPVIPSPFSNDAQAMAQRQAAAPGTLVATGGNSLISLHWTNYEGTGSVEVWRAPVSGANPDGTGGTLGTYALLVTVPENQDGTAPTVYVDTEVTNGEVWSYKVRATPEE